MIDGSELGHESHLPYTKGWRLGSLKAIPIVAVAAEVKEIQELVVSIVVGVVVSMEAELAVSTRFDFSLRCLFNTEEAKSVLFDSTTMEDECPAPIRFNDLTCFPRFVDFFPATGFFLAINFPLVADDFFDTDFCSFSFFEIVCAENNINNNNAELALL